VTRPDAVTVAAAMNARPLPADTDGGVWVGGSWSSSLCDNCGTRLRPGPFVTDGYNILCLPCAMADVQRAHAAADPNSHTDREVKS